MGGVGNQTVMNEGRLTPASPRPSPLHGEGALRREIIVQEFPYTFITGSRSTSPAALQ